MDDLILRHLQGEISDLEERLLQNWRQAAPENEQGYQQLARLWSIEPAAGPEGAIPARPLLDSILRKAEDRRTAALPLHRRVLKTRRSLALPLAVAAVLVLALGLATLRQRAAEGFGAAELATGAAETATLTLTDGTFVRLGPDSRLRLPAERSASGPSREVWLDGQAYFAVKSDSTHPFLIHTRAGVARVLGTHFELRTREDDLRLAVVEGRVALSAGSAEVEVEAGEVSHIRDGGPPSVVEVADVDALLDWPDGLLVFQSMPLAQVARELERHFGTRVVVADPVIAQRKITGWFSDESLEAVVTAICRAAAARCEVEEERVVIRKNEPGSGPAHRLLPLSRP